MPTFQKDLERDRFTWEEVEDAAVDRSRWRQAAVQCAELRRGTKPSLESK